MSKPLEYRQVAQMVRDGYDRVAGRYLLSRSANHDTSALQQLTADLQLGAHVLDVGCGCGWPVSAWLSRHGYRVTGLDISPVQVRLAREQVPGAYFAIRDACTLQPRELAVDAIACADVLFHIPSRFQQNLLSTFRSYLHSGGRIFLTFGTVPWEGVEESVAGVPMFWSQRKPAENRRMVEAAGFNISEDRIVANQAMPVQRILARAR